MDVRQLAEPARITYCNLDFDGVVKAAPPDTARSDRPASLAHCRVPP
jgi:hypothetical protein